MFHNFPPPDKTQTHSVRNIFPFRRTYFESQIKSTKNYSPILLFEKRAPNQIGRALHDMCFSIVNVIEVIVSYRFNRPVIRTRTGNRPLG